MTKSSNNQIYVFDIRYTLPEGLQCEVMHDQRLEVCNKFNDIMKSHPDYYFQLERGKIEHKFHIQCYMKVEKKKFDTQMASILSDLGFPNIRVKPASNAGKEALKSYCIKNDETFISGPWSKRPVYRARDLECMKNPYPFQQEIIDIIKTDPNDRNIIWIYNPEGNVGKSKLLKFLCYNKLATRIPIGTAGQMKQVIAKKPASRCYVLNIPKSIGSQESQHDMLTTIEEIKDGWIFGCMFGEDNELFMEPPHVIIMSNEVPNIHLASLDRWDVYKIDNKEDFLEEKLSINELQIILNKQIENKKNQSR